MRQIPHGHSGIGKQGRRYSLLIAAVTILGGVLLALLIKGYASQFRTTFSLETQAYMNEIAQQATVVMNDRIETNIHNMETISVALSILQPFGASEATTFLRTEAERYGYSSLSLAGTDGIALGNSGVTYNVSTRKHFLSALKGETTVSGVITSDYGNHDGVEFAIPLKENGVVTGVLIAGYDLSAFGDILRVHMFGGLGSALVIDSDGVVIVNNGDEKAYNFYYFLKDTNSIDGKMLTEFQGNIKRGATGVINYSRGQTGYMLHYQPLGINDWSLLISAPTDSITQKTNLFLLGTTYIGIAIATLVSFLMLAIIMLQSKNRKTLETLLYVDPITGGANQAKFEEEARILIAKKGTGTYAMVQMNVEKFKLINTTFGRKAGDRLLKHIYQIISSQLEPYEVVGRYHADRFCLLLEFHSQEAITAKLSKLCASINQFNDALGTKYILQFSEGVCIVDEPHPDISILYERANFARTHGGAPGGRSGTIAFYDELERSVIMREKEIENRMEDALANNEFEVYLQPKYELKNNTVAGAEALVRWNDPQAGLIYPNDFIPLFERNGFIVRIDLYMFEKVCDLLQKWYDNGDGMIPISVNLSRVHLEHADFLDRYREIYSRYTFPSKFVEIELTESIVFNNMERLCSVIDDIHAIGFECSMDDFGSGYSSLNMLKDIPVDTLKLDRAFFYSKSGNDDKSRFVIENIINLAQKLSMKTVSEGVETLEQVEHLRKAKCEMVQGYVFAKPMTVHNFERLLAHKEKA